MKPPKITQFFSSKPMKWIDFLKTWIGLNTKIKYSHMHQKIPSNKLKNGHQYKQLNWNTNRWQPLACHMTNHGAKFICATFNKTTCQALW
jgi:hypothetical protein